MNNFFPPLSSFIPRHLGALALLDNLAGAQQRTSADTARPAVNVWREDQRLLIQAELPGVTAEDLEIQVQGNQLTLSGTRKDTLPAEAQVRRRERRAGPFRRVLELPVPVDAENVTAQLEQGVLTITLPLASSVLPRLVPVQGTNA